MASLLGNLIYAGLQTLLSTQANLGAVNQNLNLYSINTGSIGTTGLDSSHFVPSVLGQGVTALGAGVGYGACTLQPLLFTRSGATVVYANLNTTAVPGEILAAYWHTRVR